MSNPKGRPWPALTTNLVMDLKNKEALRASLFLSLTGSFLKNNTYR